MFFVRGGNSLRLFYREEMILSYLRSQNEHMKNRTFYIIAFVGVLVIEIIIGVYVRDRFVRPYIGDVLVVLLVYYFVRIFIPYGVRLLPWYVLGFACFVEILQYFQLTDTLGIENRVMRIVLGSTFDIKDIICYVVGSFCCLVSDKLRK